MITRKCLWTLLCVALLILVSCVKAPELTLTSSSSLELSVDGSSGSITFTANRDWTVSCSDSWVTVSPSKGTASDGTVTVTVRCNANTTYEDRSATVTIRMEELSKTVTVRQPANLGVIVSTQSFVLTSEARTIDVDVQANVQYTVETSVDWIKQPGTKGLTSTKYSFSILENTTYDDREGRITIKAQSGGVPDQVITVKQAQKDAIIVKDTSFDMPYGGGEIEFKVEANVAFDVKTDSDWIHYVSTKALSTSTVKLKIDENATFSARSGKVEVTQQGGSLKHTITVNQAGRIAVTSIELDKTSLTLKPEETATLVATVKPDNATDKTVTWTSSDPEIATVDETGKVTAVKIGKATITAKAGEKTTECKVTVLIPVSSVELDKTTLELKPGETATLVATVKPDNATDKTVTWTSSDPEIATVDETGKVMAVKIGTATITAKAGEKTAECKVTVSIPVSSVELDKTTLELKPGETATLVATVKPDDATDMTVTWTSSDASIASVDANGKVTAIKDGTATITAKAGEKTATCKVTVCSIPVTSVELNSTCFGMDAGDTATLVATINPNNATDKTVTWTSSDPEIATVDANGKVKAVKVGTATITAKAGEKSAECIVVVGSAPDGAVNLGIVRTRDDGSRYILYWAKCNVGASKPEGYGYYYAWGETETKSDYDWWTYKWVNGAYYKLTKYCPTDKTDYWDGAGSPDGKTVLDPEDDVAHVKLGGKWRMPTKAEQDTLRSQCTWTWTTKNGVNGYEVKSKVNSNSIFLPAAGYRYSTNLINAGSYGYYWSSSVLTNNPNYACYVGFDSGGVGWGNYGRYDGFSVRPVTE